MTAQPAQQQSRPLFGTVSRSRFMFFVMAVLFIIASFAAGGHPLLDIPEWTWGFAGFAAFGLAYAL
jgi:hypothetical protein